MKLSFKKIENILIKYDPIGLIRMGAPLDEYKSEAKLIHNSLKVLNKNPGLNYVQELVSYIFRESFNEDDDKSFCAWMHHTDLTVIQIALDLCKLMDKK